MKDLVVANSFAHPFLKNVSVIGKLENHLPYPGYSFLFESDYPTTIIIVYVVENKLLQFSKVLSTTHLIGGYLVSHVYLFEPNVI